MKRIAISLILTVFLLAQCLLPVAASGGTSPEVVICSAYWQDGQLYTFAQFSHEDPASQNTMLLVNNIKKAEATPRGINEAGGAIHYLLLIDVSPSMVAYRNGILQFAQELMKSQQNVKVSVAAFHSQFHLVKANMTAWEDVKATIRSLSYNRDGTDINGSVAAALDYFGSGGYSAGEMPNIVVITDGDPWYSNSSAVEKEQEALANKKGSILTAAYPEIVLHSYSFGKWDPDAFASLNSEGGIHIVGGKAKEAGARMAEYSDSIYSVVYRLSGYNGVALIPDSLMVMMGNHIISYPPVRNAGIKPEVDIDLSQATVSQGESESSEETVPEETTAPTDSAETTAATTAATETQPSASDPSKASQPSTEAHSGNSLGLLYILLATAALVVIIFVVILLISAKRKRTEAVQMRIEVLNNDSIRTKKLYHLSREIVIGSGKRSDIVIPGDASVSTDVRIIKRGQLIYVEDFGSTDDTLLNGMRIFTSNRLRSGDEITVGNVTLRVLF